MPTRRPKSLKRISAVIFDCDGVMFDSRQANIRFYNHLLAHFNLPPMNEEAVDVVHMQTADASVRHIFRGTPHVEAAQAYRKQLDYTPFIQDMVMEPGLRRLLSLLRPRFGLAVATNRSNTILSVLDLNGLRDCFDIVVSSLDVLNPKPHPESLFRILDHLHLSSDQGLYIGDSMVDAQTAAAAGVPFVAYKNNALEADYHVHHLLEVAELVGAGHEDG